jgi:ribonuclease HI
VTTDERGCFVRAFSKRFLGILEIAEAEVCGVRKALHWLSIIDMENATIEIESDYL